MVAVEDASSNIIYNKLSQSFEIDHIIFEQKVSRSKFVKRRIKKLGFITVFGQILFQFIISTFLSFTSKKRIEAIKDIYGLSDQSIVENKLSRVASINGTASIEKIKTLQPDLIIVNGTRIISKKVLESAKAKFINIHAGITPQYRGVHGAYWALLNNDLENCGVTIHLLDAGIDTGTVLAQKKISPTTKDNFKTYPFLQLGEGLQLLQTVIKDFSNDNITEINRANFNSQLWYHPTIWSYLINRFTKGVK